MKYSKNQQVAKAFIRWLMDRPQYDKLFAVQRRLPHRPDPDVGEARPVGEGPQAGRPSGTRAKIGRGPAGPARRTGRPPRPLVKYILVDMYAQAIQGMKPEDAAKWAEAELKKAYA